MWANWNIQYAIRPSVSGNKNFNRDIIIKTVANAVGPEHPVNLKNYDLLIIVTVIQVGRPSLPLYSKYLMPRRTSSE